jgi:hypothetical protein
MPARADRHVIVLAVVAIVSLVTAPSPAAGRGPDYSPPPGALNPRVTQSNISSTICVRGWTATIRPPLAYTAKLKWEQVLARHLPGQPSDYQEDHFIPLELGGHPTDPHNLWPQPWPEAKRKDRWELSLNRAVCAGRMTLSMAQRKVADPSLWR